MEYCSDIFFVTKQYVNKNIHENMIAKKEKRSLRCHSFKAGLKKIFGLFKLEFGSHFE